MKNTLKIALLSVVAIGMSGAAAVAAPITVSSYNMPNGDGQASGGTYNYWDKNYSGAGATTTDGAALSGGKGDLTDGVTTTNLWYNTENGAGTGPYVGWYFPKSPNPIVTFNFSGSPTITGLGIWLDNSNVGGVYSPDAILIDGVSTAFTSPAVGTAGLVTFSGLDLTGGSHTIEFDQANSAWVFVNEVEFSGTASSVPEPFTLSLFGAGLAGATALRRRKKAKA